MDNSSAIEEIARFAKALNSCRTCSHAMMLHFFIKPSSGQCMDIAVNIKGKYKRCPCALFIPADNLEFLEWAAKNKDKK
jgi:hypothetical protein